MRWTLSVLSCFLVTLCAFSQDCPIPTSSDKSKDAVPFCLVAQKIESALAQYNQTLSENGGGKPLALSNADFDFKTVTSKSGGFSFSILVLKLGATRQVDSTNEVTYSYAVPQKKSGDFAPQWAPQDFSAQLIQAIRQASKEMQSVPSLGKAQFKTLTLNLSYGVKWDFSAGLTLPIQLVTIAPNVDRNQTATQSVKLTFVDPSVLAAP